MGNNKSKTLYHYCSLDTFLNIIKNSSIWLSDVQKSNDCREMAWFRQQYYEFLLEKYNNTEDEDVKTVCQIIFSIAANDGFDKCPKWLLPAVNINSQASPGGGGFLTKELNENGKWVTKEGVVGEGGLLLNSKSKNIKVVGKIDILDTQNPWDLAKASGTSSMVFMSDDINECYSFKSYIECKATRFKILIGMSKLIIMDNGAFKFVDDPGEFDHIFTDAELYSKYEFTEDEIQFIESIIK